MKLYERLENNNFDEIDRNRAIELIEGGNGHLVYNENYFKLQKENEKYKRLAKINLENAEEFKDNMCEHRCLLKSENEELKEDLKYVLNQTLGAFEKNWCIDWNFTEIREKYNLESE